MANYFERSEHSRLATHFLLKTLEYSDLFALRMISKEISSGSVPFACLSCTGAENSICWTNPGALPPAPRHKSGIAVDEA
jgi:hypothetical protein